MTEPKLAALALGLAKICAWSLRISSLMLAPRVSARNSSSSGDMVKLFTAAAPEISSVTSVEGAGSSLSSSTLNSEAFARMSSILTLEVCA